LKRIALLFLILSAAPAAPDSALVDRVGSTGFVQLEAESFRKLTPREQALAYWLSQASIAIDPIIYDQLSRFGLRQKRLLENIVMHPQGVAPDAMKKIVDFTKLFWANKGNHNENTSQKFLPEFTFDELKTAAGPNLAAEVEALKAGLFDPDFEPMITAKSPRGSLDILQSSANNFYSPGLGLAEIQAFHEQYSLNSRLTKTADGALVEQVYRAGTPDGKVPPGLYADELGQACNALEKARAYAEPEQAKAIASLVRFYRTGDPRDWIQFGIDWVRTNPAVDFDNGFIEVYRDARGAKGSSQSFVTVTDESLASRMHKLSDNAQYFEDHAPWLPQYKMQGVKPPVAKAVEALIETGDFHVTTIGDNLPNENEVHEKYGSKSFMFTASSHVLEHATGSGPLEEFAASPEEIAIGKKYGDEAEDLMTALHEVIGHGSGKLNPKLTHEASYYLKEYFSTLEEARADLMALWNAFDPKLKELGLISSPEVAKAMYYSAARVALVQLRRIPKGDTIEEDHQRDRQLIARYIMDKTGAIEQLQRNGKTYITVRDFEQMRKGVGMLLAELMRIKAEGDYAAIKALVDRYGVHFDAKLRDQVVTRYGKLNLPTYWAGINPQLIAELAPDGAVQKVTMSYPRDYMRQQLANAFESRHARPRPRPTPPRVLQ
jgi:dipeptidyl-peptidase-3